MPPRKPSTSTRIVNATGNVATLPSDAAKGARAEEFAARPAGSQAEIPPARHGRRPRRRDRLHDAAKDPRPPHRSTPSFQRPRPPSGAGCRWESSSHRGNAFDPPKPRSPMANALPTGMVPQPRSVWIVNRPTRSLPAAFPVALGNSPAKAKARLVYGEHGGAGAHRPAELAVTQCAHLEHLGDSGLP